MLWKDGRTVVLVPSGTATRDGRLSDNGWIAAEVGDLNAGHPRRWRADGTADGALAQVGAVVAVNNDGAVAVRYQDAFTGAHNGGLWRRDRLVELRPPAGLPSSGYVAVADVNNRGETVGTAFDPLYGRAPEGVRCDSTGACAALRLPNGSPAVGVFPQAIDDRGQVAACGCVPGTTSTVHLWTGGVAAELPRHANALSPNVSGRGSLNERGDVVGAAGSTDRFVLGEINDNGDVVASEYTGSGRDVVFHRGGAKTTLPLLPLRSEGVATGLTNTGRVVGSSAYPIGSFPDRTVIDRATPWDVR